VLRPSARARRPVNELAEAVQKAPAGVSQHLAKLRMARLVQPRRQGNQTFYSMDNAHGRQLVEDAIHHTEHATGVVRNTSAAKRSPASCPAPNSERAGG